MAIKRRQILEAVKTRLQTISVAGGYHTGVGSNVFIWKSDPFQQHQLPALNIIRGANTVEDEFLRSTASGDNISQYILSVGIDIICQPGSVVHDDMEDIISDVYKAIGVDPTWGGLALQTWAVDDEVSVQKHSGEGSSFDKIVGGGTINIRIQYRTSKWQET